MHFCARARSGFSPSTYAHRDALAMHVTAPLGEVEEENPERTRAQKCITARQVVTSFGRFTAYDHMEAPVTSDDLSMISAGFFRFVQKRVD